MENFLEIDNISFSYHQLSGETLTLSDISFTMKAGDFLAIVGPSGCGKSTLLSLIAGLIVPDNGTIRVATKSIGYMLQHDQLFEWRSTWSNVSLGLEIQNKLNEENKKRITSMLETYGLSSFTQSKPSALSGGMRQRAALIRTLLLEPDLLLLDEPFSALDYQTRLMVADDIADILHKEGKTAILVTHDIAEAISFADHVIVLTKRPSTVKATYDIHLSIDKRTPLASRSASEFTDYFNNIWKEMID